MGHEYFSSARRRLARGHRLPYLALLIACILAGLRAQEITPSFDEWLEGVRREALARGISETVVVRALEGLAPSPVVMERDQRQTEFVLPLASYLQRRVTPQVVRAGRQQASRHRSLLTKVSATYGVDAATLVSVWGLESNFGRFSGVRPTIAAIATLAYDARRGAFFREQLFAALEILDSGEVEFSKLKGSWAGAMGQPQFMPSTYLEFAVDFDGDQRRDIWSSSADVLASIANYLKQHGWRTGQRWGRRVTIPSSATAAVTDAVVVRTAGCRAVRDLSEPLPVDRWQALGVRLAGGKRLPASQQPASLLRIETQAFLVYANYEAILSYNCAHSYALSVALLSDRIAGR